MYLHLLKLLQIKLRNRRSGSPSLVQHFLQREPEVIIEVIRGFVDEARDDISKSNHANDFIVLSSHRIDPVNRF